MTGEAQRLCRKVTHAEYVGSVASPEALQRALDVNVDPDMLLRYLANYRLVNIPLEDAQFMVTSLVNAGADVNGRDYVPLTDTVINDKLNVIRALLMAGANPNRRLEESATPLLHACDFGRVEMVVMLLKYGADVNIRVGDSHALDLAFNRDNDIRILKVLLDSCKINWGNVPRRVLARAFIRTINASDESKNSWNDILSAIRAGFRSTDVVLDGKTAVHHFLQNGMFNTLVSFLKEFKPNLNLPGVKTHVLSYSLSERVVFYSRMPRHSKFISTLLIHGADRDARNADGSTALHHACRMSRVPGTAVHYHCQDTVKSLITERTVNCPLLLRANSRPLILAIDRDNLFTVRTLLKGGADPTIRDEISGHDALSYAREQKGDISDAIVEVINDHLQAST